jgi:PAS domain S-box-containing protein
LRESESRVRALLDASQDNILLVATDGIVLAVNAATERRLGLQRHGRSPVGAHLGELLAPHDAAAKLQAIETVTQTSMLAQLEEQVGTRWFEVWVYPVNPGEGTVGEVAIYARDITGRKRAEAELRMMNQALHQSPVSVVITDPNGDIQYVNPKFCESTGYTAAEVQGRNPRILKSGHTPPETYEGLWQTIRAGQVWRGELLNKRKDGTLFWELASISGVRNGDGITNFVCVKEDITARKSIEEQLRQSQKLQALGQLTGGIAHDFNNLLAIIIGNLQLLSERIPADERTRALLQDAIWSAQRGGELTHRLLAFARRQPLKPGVIELNEVIDKMSDLLRRTIGAGIEIRTRLDPELWKALADRGELERALVNLAVNARDAMWGKGTLTLETRNVHLGSEYADQYQEVTPGDYAMLAVTDTGCGMSPDVLKHVFEPFFTTKEFGKGSGLGLSMVYGFAKQSEGHVSIYSDIGHGTTVKLYLPRSGMRQARSDSRPAAVPAGYFTGRSVLVVEDEPKLRKVAVAMLSNLGFQVTDADHGEEALRLLDAQTFDVLFTDLELPGGMDGAELANTARARRPGLQVLFTTGYAREAVLSDSELQQTPCLLKPYAQEELAQELVRLFAATPAQPAAAAAPERAN